MDSSTRATRGLAKRLACPSVDFDVIHKHPRTTCTIDEDGLPVYVVHDLLTPAQLRASPMAQTQAEHLSHPGSLSTPSVLHEPHGLPEPHLPSFLPAQVHTLYLSEPDSHAASQPQVRASELQPDTRANSCSIAGASNSADPQMNHVAHVNIKPEPVSPAQVTAQFNPQTDLQADSQAAPQPPASASAQDQSCPNQVQPQPQADPQHMHPPQAPSRQDPPQPLLQLDSTMAPQRNCNLTGHKPGPAVVKFWREHRDSPALHSLKLVGDAQQPAESVGIAMSDLSIHQRA